MILDPDPTQPWCVGVVAIVLCATQRGLGPGQAIFKAKASIPGHRIHPKIQPGHWGFDVPIFPKQNRFQDSNDARIRYDQ